MRSREFDRVAVRVNRGAAAPEARVAAEQDGPRDGLRAEAVADLVEGGVERVARVERERELDGARVVEVGDRDADERQALPLDHRHRRDEQLARRGEDRVRLRGRARQRVRAGRPREVVEAQAQDDRAADAVRRRASGG